MDLNLRIAGAAGQGVETMGELLTDTFASLGLHVFTTQTYMSRIRGGLNWFDIRIADHELFAGRERVDLLVALLPEAVELLSEEVEAEGRVLLAGASPEVGVGTPALQEAGIGVPALQRPVIAIDFAAVAKELTGATVMANSVAAGAVVAMLGYDLAPLFARLEAIFLGKKGQEVVEANVRCAQRGAELARASQRGGIAASQSSTAPHAGQLRAPAAGSGDPAPSPSLALGVRAGLQVISGNEAIAYGLAAAGVQFVAAYPMTPSTGIFTTLAGIHEEYGILVEQAEDEIAAINMVLGAAYAGAPAACMTSGGGFALMVEGVALAGMLELPALIVLGQRPGPATGLPTRTAQQELRFALHAGHGEFAKALYAPGTPEQAFALARVALETAHKYQTPVILLSDQFLADMRKNLQPLDTTLRPIDRHVLLDPPEDYLRYAITDSGVSPRALPGGPALVVVDSDEHTEDGHLTEDLAARVRMQDKRMRKLEGMRAEALAPEWYGPPEATDLLVCWGSTYGPCREAVDLLNGSGTSVPKQGSVAMLHFSQVWPIGEQAHTLLGRAARITVVEGNQTGQFAGLLAEVGAVRESALIARYDGLPFTGEEIARRYTDA